jgi:hypothetical protein
MEVTVRSLTPMSLVLTFLLTMNGSLAAGLPYPASTDNAPLAHNRLVVFEGFMRST